MTKSALITGITGQDGSYLAELLLSKGYSVHGIIRRSSSFNTARIDHIYQDRHAEHRRMNLHYGDLTDSTGLRRILEMAQPDEVYNLGAQSHVKSCVKAMAAAISDCPAVWWNQRQFATSIRIA